LKIGPHLPKLLSDIKGLNFFGISYSAYWLSNSNRFSTGRSSEHIRRFRFGQTDKQTDRQTHKQIHSVTLCKTKTYAPADSAGRVKNISNTKY